MKMNKEIKQQYEAPAIEELELNQFEVIRGDSMDPGKEETE